MKHFLLLCFILSCSHAPPRSATVRKISVASVAEAKAVIRNQVSFLSDIFIQSHDPYYNLPKWSEACLAGNSIGPIEETSSGIRSVSTLWLKNNEAGYCPGREGTVRSWVIFGYCPSRMEVVELKAPVSENPDINPEEICSI